MVAGEGISDAAVGGLAQGDRNKSGTLGNRHLRHDTDADSRLDEGENASKVIRFEEAFELGFGAIADGEDIVAEAVPSA